MGKQTSTKGDQSKQQKSVRIPEIQLTPAEREEIKKRLPGIRRDVESITGKWEDLRTKYPDEFKRATKKHPRLGISISMMSKVVSSLEKIQHAVPNDEVLKMIDQYNTIAKDINTMTKDAAVEETAATCKDRDETLKEAAAGKLKFDDISLTPSDQEEMRQFAHDLFRELFPESHTDRFVKWASDQELEGYQKILLAPANGIESAVTGFIDLFKAKTYKELFKTVQVMSGMSFNDWCAVLKMVKFACNNVSTSEKIAPVLSLICAITFLFGGFSRIAEVAKKMGYSRKFIDMVGIVFKARTAAHITAPLGKALPLSVIGGVSLPYLPIGSVKK